jgi:N-acetylglucosamine-6-phosphate deacetylase
VIELSGADLVLPDRVLHGATLVIEDDRIADVRAASGAGTRAGCTIVPGFIDLHVHGVEGIDTLGSGRPIADIAARLPRFGTVAFCPTTVACSPEALRRVIGQVAEAQRDEVAASARVLPAHLESNFLNPEYNGAQPVSCLRVPKYAIAEAGGASNSEAARLPDTNDDFAGGDILREIDRGRSAVGLVTLAPEIDGGLDLIAWLRTRHIRPALGHSGASYDEAMAAIHAGASHATHLFNRMPPLDPRRPGLAGAVLQSPEVTAEIICDGRHVHPALVRTAIRAKGTANIVAITDGTAAAGLPVGARARLGSQEITAGPGSALLDAGTMAGSVITMDAAFRMLVADAGLSLVDAATVCAASPARELGLDTTGALKRGMRADLAVLDRDLRVVETYVAGRLVYAR